VIADSSVTGALSRALADPTFGTRVSSGTPAAAARA
jgi:hypothetical protein